MLTKLSWWLSQEAILDRLEAITAETLRFFLAYLRDDLSDSCWGSDAPSAARPARPTPVDTYYRCLRAFLLSTKKVSLHLAASSSAILAQPGAVAEMNGSFPSETRLDGELQRKSSFGRTNLFETSYHLPPDPESVKGFSTQGAITHEP